LYILFTMLVSGSSGTTSNLYSKTQITHHLSCSAGNSFRQWVTVF